METLPLVGFGGQVELLEWDLDLTYPIGLGELVPVKHLEHHCLLHHVRQGHLYSILKELTCFALLTEN